MFLVKAVVVWMAIALAEIGNGVARGLWLTPRFGDLRARQISVLTGSLSIFCIALVSMSWIAPTSQRECLEVGALWFSAMLVFEIWFGRRVFHLPWRAILADFDLRRGRLLALGFVWLALAPWATARLLGLL